MGDVGDEMAKEAASTAVQLFLGPAANVLKDAVGGSVGDRIAAWRRRKPAWQELHQSEAVERAREILAKRDVKVVSEDARPEHIDHLLNAAKDASDPNIKELFARLLASAVDPARKKNYRPEFADVVRQLEPLDALVLKEFARPGSNPSLWRNEIAAAVGRNPDDVILAAKNLLRLECIEPQQPSQRIENAALLTPRGRTLLSLVAD
jgi:hypothetical protein